MPRFLPPEVFHDEEWHGIETRVVAAFRNRDKEALISWIQSAPSLTRLRVEYSFKTKHQDTIYITKSLLEAAVDTKWNEGVAALCRYGQVKDLDEGMQALYQATKHGSLKSIKALLKAGVNPNGEKGAPPLASSDLGALQITSELIKKSNRMVEAFDAADFNPWEEVVFFTQRHTLFENLLHYQKVPLALCVLNSARNRDLPLPASILDNHPTFWQDFQAICVQSMKITGGQYWPHSATCLSSIASTLVQMGMPMPPFGCFEHLKDTLQTVSVDQSEAVQHLNWGAFSELWEGVCLATGDERAREPIVREMVKLSNLLPPSNKAAWEDLALRHDTPLAVSHRSVRL